MERFYYLDYYIHTFTVLLLKLIFSQMVKEFSCIYGIRNENAVIKGTRHLSLS